MLRRPTLCGPRAVVIGPDNLILKAFPSKNLVKHHLAIVNFTAIYVEEQATGGSQNPPSLLHSGTQKSEEVLKLVVVRSALILRQPLSPVASSAETRAISCSILYRSDTAALLSPARVERRVYVDQCCRLGLHPPQSLQVVTMQNAIQSRRSPRQQTTLSLPHIALR